MGTLIVMAVDVLTERNVDAEAEMNNRTSKCWWCSLRDIVQTCLLAHDSGHAIRNSRYQCQCSEICLLVLEFGRLQAPLLVALILTC